MKSKLVDDASGQPETTAAPNEDAERRLFPATPRGARHARHWAAGRLDAHGLAAGSEQAADILLVIAELVANAVTHARVPGRGFVVTVKVSSQRVRAEVTDARPECRLQPADPTAVEADSDERGRGLLLVAALSDAWGCDHGTAVRPTKTVWAEFKR
ncbi:ATP-binding protein [Streptomyces fungicidicus]